MKFTGLLQTISGDSGVGTKIAIITVGGFCRCRSGSDNVQIGDRHVQNHGASNGDHHSDGISSVHFSLDGQFVVSVTISGLRRLFERGCTHEAVLNSSIIFLFFGHLGHLGLLGQVTCSVY